MDESYRNNLNIVLIVPCRRFSNELISDISDSLRALLVICNFIKYELLHPKTAESCRTAIKQNCCLLLVSNVSGE